MSAMAILLEQVRLTTEDLVDVAEDSVRIGLSLSVLAAKEIFGETIGHGSMPFGMVTVAFGILSIAGQAFGSCCVVLNAEDLYSRW